MVFVLRKDMAFEARPLSLYMESAWLIDSGIVLLHAALNLPQLTLLFTVWFPTIMSIGQALSVPMSKVDIFQIK